MLRPCNDFHLVGSCSRGADCLYSHEPVAPNILPAVARGARSVPCALGLGCRNGVCVQRHVCPYPACRGQGAAGRPCKFAREQHEVDVSEVREWDGVA